jgi:fermentation-respiration switch protein FrsA (DUF1100 family)
VIKRSEHLAHFKANAVAPIEVISSVRVPILLIHGMEDDRVDPFYAEALYRQANEPKELWFIPGARHHNVAEVGGKEYEERIADFLERHLIMRTSG